MGRMCVCVGWGVPDLRRPINTSNAENYHIKELWWWWYVARRVASGEREYPLSRRNTRAAQRDTRKQQQPLAGVPWFHCKDTRSAKVHGDARLQRPRRTGKTATRKERNREEPNKQAKEELPRNGKRALSKRLFGQKSRRRRRVRCEDVRRGNHARVDACSSALP
ncbi:hypothetical protein MRX96_056765 [Rhipicephalus microplus]